MTNMGERRPPSARAPAPRRVSGVSRLRPRSMPLAVAQALLVALLAAAAWALLKGILEYGLGLLVVAAVGGWAIGAVLSLVRPAPILAAAIGALGWLLGLLLSWLLAMAILPGSSRTFLERLENTPFLDWLAPQLGALDVVGLLLFTAAAAYGARRGR